MMFDKIKEEIGQDYYRQNFPNDGQRFVAWYLRNVPLRDQNEAKADITDGADDKQIDAIFVDDDNSTVYVVQGKFVGADTIDAEPLREVLSAWLQLKDLVRLQETANNKLKMKLAEVAIALDDDYDVMFELLTTGTLTPSAQADFATFQAQFAKADDLPASIHLVDRDELQRRYDLALERENPSISHTLKLEPGKYLSLELAGTRVLLASIPLKDCIAFPGIKDGSLFQKNVRQSLGLSNAVNKGISDHLRQWQRLLLLPQRRYGNLQPNDPGRRRDVQGPWVERCQRLPVTQHDPVVQRESENTRQRLRHVPLLRDSAARTGGPDQRLDQLAESG